MAPHHAAALAASAAQNRRAEGDLDTVVSTLFSAFGRTKPK